MQVADYTAGRESHPAPKNYYFIYLILKLFVKKVNMKNVFHSLTYENGFSQLDFTKLRFYRHSVYFNIILNRHKQIFSAVYHSGFKLLN